MKPALIILACLGVAAALLLCLRRQGPNSRPETSQTPIAQPQQAPPTAPATAVPPASASSVTTSITAVATQGVPTAQVTPPPRRGPTIGPAFNSSSRAQTNTISAGTGGAVQPGSRN